LERVRVGSKYRFEPNMLDTVDAPYGVRAGILHKGDIVRVINKHGCPKVNTMGHCYIETMSGEFCGLVSVRSLTH
jgi:hypothetical protein